MGLDGACPTIYGPVESRRHGRSLGINLGSPDKKVCTWGCVYCQCGHGERREPVPSDGVPLGQDVLLAVKAALSQVGALDSVTFAGNSEPGSHPEFLEIVRELRKLKYAMRAKWVLNCLSNGSELDRPDVVSACDLLDEAWIKLDCGTDDLFKRLSHPIDQVGGVQEHVARIQRLKSPRIQSLFWTSPQKPIGSNWTVENREALIPLYKKIGPAEIHLTTVSREPAWRGAEPAPPDELNSYGDQLRLQGFNVRVFQ